MTAKQYLRKLRFIQKNIDTLQEEIARLRSRLESTAVPSLGDRVQSSGTHDRFADAIASLADKEIQYSDLLETYEKFRQQIVAKILSMDNDIYARILYARYVQNKTLGSIADDLAYSIDRMKHLHGEALDAFQKKYLR